MRKGPWLRLLLLAVLGACSVEHASTARRPVNAPVNAPVREVTPAPSPPSHVAATSTSVRAGGRSEANALAQFDAELKKHPDLTYDGLARELSLATAADPPLPFDPTQARYYDLVVGQLALTEEEKAIFKKTGVLAVDHVRPYSIGSAYHAIYARDLPVLITTDSVLHALHRSYDNILMELEGSTLTAALEESLSGAHDALAKSRASFPTPAVVKSAEDVDVYLTVARSLLAGSAVPSKLGKDAEVKALLARVDALNMETTQLRGGSRVIDFSQFAPRGHYTKSEGLKRYFRMLMWLGRADTGFVMGPPDRQSGIEVDAERETRGAAILAWTFQSSGKQARLRSVSDVIDFFVGASDNATLDEVVRVLDRSGLKEPAAFADDAKMRAFVAGLAETSTQNIRSQALLSDSTTDEKVIAPKLFQVFGQRFIIDSFILSQVVFDSIVFEGKKQERMMPSPLDAMAALGNDEATRLLRPEIEKHKYAANLLAARKVVDARPASAWEADIYGMWVGALRTLNRAPSGTYAPTVMQREPWRRKTLETQLSSWSQLRHDTILYAKQSYTATTACGYPAGYVEPYPDFYATLGKLGRKTSERLAAMSLAPYAAHFARFADVMDVLERLARKELAAEPYTTEEDRFIKATISISGGSGPPTYSGWYRTLVYGEKADKWHPTIADVHTDGDRGEVLEVGVGNASFLMVAIDNGPDRAVYVGPISSFYAFRQPMSARLTDEKWQERIEAKTFPPRPAFTSAYRGASKERDLGPWPQQRTIDPEAQKLIDRVEKSRASAAERAAAERQLMELMDRLQDPPLPPATSKPAPKR